MFVCFLTFFGPAEWQTLCTVVPHEKSHGGWVFFGLASNQTQKEFYKKINNSENSQFPMFHKMELLIIPMFVSFTFFSAIPGQWVTYFFMRRQKTLPSIFWPFVYFNTSFSTCGVFLELGKIERVAKKKKK